MPFSFDEPSTIPSVEIQTLAALHATNIEQLEYSTGLTFGEILKIADSALIRSNPYYASLAKRSTVSLSTSAVCIDITSSRKLSDERTIYKRSRYRSTATC